LQSLMLMGCAGWPRRGEPPGRGRRDRGAAQEKVGKSSENRPFYLVQSLHLGTTGVSAHRMGRLGTRTGELSCCGSGAEPVTGFVGVCSVLLLLFSQSQAVHRTPRHTPTSSSTPLRAPRCIRLI